MFLAISYSCIAPLVLGFATVGIYFLYVAFRYNVFYVLTMVVDTKGDAYGRAMQHLSVGVYLAELCLIGLMGARGANGPAGLIVVLFILTIIFQVYLNLVLTPLTNTLSDELMAEDEEEALAQASEEGDAPIDGSQDRIEPRRPSAKGADIPVVSFFVSHIRRGGIFAPFLFHGSRSNYPQFREELWEAFPGRPTPKIPEEIIEHAYHHPSITAKAPKLWIAKDDLGVSAQEILASRDYVDMTDEGTKFNEKGKIEWVQKNARDAPIWKERVEY